MSKHLLVRQHILQVKIRSDSRHYIIIKNIEPKTISSIVLVSRVSGRHMGHQNTQKSPLKTLKSFVRNFQMSITKYIIEFLFHLNIITMTLQKDIMPYFNLVNTCLWVLSL